MSENENLINDTAIRCRYCGQRNQIRAEAREARCGRCRLPLSDAYHKKFSSLRVSTPTLIIHAENDFRCPIEQAEQYLMALLRNGTQAELLRFPEEGHELSRSGKPRHRLERFEAVLDWHDRHL